MDSDLALKFLKNHQPMPSDEDLSEDLIETYDEIREHFLITPDKRCIELFLNSFGYIDGFGVYQLVENVILQFSKEDVLPHLLKALKSKHAGVKYWNAQISSNYPCLELIMPLKDLLYDENIDVRSSALIGLEACKFPETVVILEKYLQYEKDEYLLKEAKEVILYLTQ